MFYIKSIFYFILLHFIIATPQFNLYYTDLVSKSNNILQHNCLRFVIYTREMNIHYPKWNMYSRETNLTNYERMSYCMNEFSSTFHVEEKSNLSRKLTFDELSKENITSQQLYLWSAPIDLIENYQVYLNQLSTSANLSYLEMEVFYNCTLPRFGPQCQYEFDYHYSNHLSLSEIIHIFYTTNEYDPTTLTCYKHLECYRGPDPACLDWSEICDGKVDCLDGHGQDEEHCWQIEINECKDNEYQCNNGQCIPETFSLDGFIIPDCIDRSDETQSSIKTEESCPKSIPAFKCEDRICKERSLTSSCAEKRKDLLMKAMFSIKDNSTSEDCWFAIKCMFDRLFSEEPSHHELCIEDSRLRTFLDTCPEMLYIPNYPILFGDTYIAVDKSHLKGMLNSNAFDPYICYNNHSHYDGSINIISQIPFTNTTCFKGSHISFLIYDMGSRPIAKYYKFIDYVYVSLRKYRLVLNYTSTVCNRSNMYQCMNSSKCIVIHQFFNRHVGCPYSDEYKMSVINNNPNIIEQLNKTHFYCQANQKYFFRHLINNGRCDCRDGQALRCTDEDTGEIDSSRDILFPTICDGFRELLPIVIKNRNETDETECEQWECHSIYTHCDGVWNCPNGADEIGCDELSISKCSANEHLCVSPSTYGFICLNISKVNDGNLDCIGGTDEPIRIISPPQPNSLLIYRYMFSCINQTFSLIVLPYMLCDGYSTCNHGDDEKFCETNVAIFNARGICLSGNIIYASDVEKFLCEFISDKYKRRSIFFKLHNIISPVKKINENDVFSSLSTIKIPPRHKFRCHRGLNLRVWLNNENDLNTNRVCLCPPSYYGDDCQYQNQRISLTMKFRASSESWRTQFAMIISLIDDSDDRIIHSYEQIAYLSLINCRTKFQMYLLYSTRPKDLTKKYSIHLDIYEKKTLTHRGSLLFPILFPFLPVHRLAFIVDIPPTRNTKSQMCSNQRCNHGKCIKYSNNPNNLTFCQCEKGWSGRFCTLQRTCMCSLDSLCIGISANNRSICLCSLNKFGPRCLLTADTKRQICENGGELVPNIPDIISNEESTCICPEGYSGNRCEIADNEFILLFDKDIVLSKEILIHFIEAMENATHIRSTTFRSIPVREDLINITWSQPFHIVFIDLFKKAYYLIVVQNIYIPSKKINKMIKPSDRCPHINELFNETFVQWHIRRIKYYHLLCQNQSLNISCFYDDLQFCICYRFGQKRLANCFNFDHNMTFNCQGQSECENGGQCFQDHPECPTKSICLCPSCFFGQQCQLTTNGFGSSLDVILGYQILPYISINHQPFIIKLSLALTIIFIIIGLINGILSLITFRNENVCQVGCGLYLLGSAIASLFTTIMFGLKFFILLLSHMSIIRNQSFLIGQCYSFDFILRIFLSIEQWLNACVAIERTITVIKGTSFNKKKSQKIAKFVIIILLIIIGVSYIHDPIHRKLIDEINYGDIRQNRIWCILKYSSNVEIYNSFIHTFHVIGPFIINLVSSIILILKKTRQQSNLRQQQQPYKEILRKTIKEHKHLLTAPIVLAIFGLPRIILIFISKCMKSADDVWLFLTGYFISFISPMLLFLIFILPSTFYKEMFSITFKQYIINILRWFGFIL